MGELTIRRNRGFAVPPYQGTAKTEKKAAAGQAQSVSRTTGFAVSETLRQLMSRVSQAENQSRESRRTLQGGESVLTEVDSGLDRLEDLLRRSAGRSDRAPLQAELEGLLEDIDRIPGDYWLRFMSSHPKDATPRLFDVMAKGRHVAKQLHLPFQSGNNRVLEEMNRRYTREKYLELIRYARSVMPGLVLTSDVIIGFPGETEAEALDTVSLVEEVGFDALFTFLYSPRPGTKAAEMPDPVPKEEKQKWFDHLLEVQNGRSAVIHAGYAGRRVRVLVDGESGDEAYPLSSRTEGNRLVRLRGDKSLVGRFLEVKITGSNTWALYWEPV